MAVKERIPDEKIERAKAADLLALTGRYTELRKIARAEYAGPCPKCAGTDRFHVHTEKGWWFCRQCHEKRGDAIAFVLWMGITHTFPEAVAYLVGETPLAPPPASGRRAPAPKPKARPWLASAWQKSAWRELGLAMREMDGKGLGLDYLAGRGIAAITARQWMLGALHIYHPGRREKLPALVIPWIDRRLRITALQYRFFAPGLEKGERFSQKAGGERIIFGATQRRPPQKAVGLILVEGELNALSIAQAIPAAVDVLSYGPQGNAKRPELATIAGRYSRVIIWADEAGQALAASQTIPAAVPLRSPDGLDANDLLQAGELRPFLAAVLERLKWPASPRGG